MLYICIAIPRTSRKYRASSVSFCPDLPKKKPEEGATTCRIIFSKCFVVFPKCRIVFRKSFLVSRKQPADCFRRLKTLKLKDLGHPIFRSARTVSKGATNRHLRPSRGRACLFGTESRRSDLTALRTGLLTPHFRFAGGAERQTGTLFTESSPRLQTRRLSLHNSPTQYDQIAEHATLTGKQASPSVISTK